MRLAIPANRHARADDLRDRSAIRLHVRVGRAWMNGVRRDAARTDITYETAIEARDRAFRQRVDRCGRKSRVLRHRAADVNNAAATLHVSERFLSRDEYARDVD